MIYIRDAEIITHERRCIFAVRYWIIDTYQKEHINFYYIYYYRVKARLEPRRTDLIRQRF